MSGEIGLTTASTNKKAHYYTDGHEEVYLYASAWRKVVIETQKHSIKKKQKIQMWSCHTPRLYS